MHSRLVSIIFCSEVLYVSGALLKWSPPVIQYKMKMPNEDGNPQNEIQSDESFPQMVQEYNEKSKYQSPFRKFNSWYSFSGPGYPTESPFEFQSLETTPSSSGIVDISLMENQKAKNYNPLCFFSAHPCSTKNKDVYYRPKTPSRFLP